MKIFFVLSSGIINEYENYMQDNDDYFGNMAAPLFAPNIFRKF